MNTAIAKPWLTLQCQMIPGVRHAVFAADPAPDGSFATLETWPENVDAPVAVLEILNSVIINEASEVRVHGHSAQAPQDKSWLVACPLRRGGTVCGAAAVEVGGIEEAQLPVITRLMEWGSAWPAFIADRDAERGAQRNPPVATVVSAALESTGFAAAGVAVATVLAKEHAAERAAIGWYDGRNIKLVAMSGRAVFDDRSDNARTLENAFSEAFDEQDTITWPATPGAPPQVHAAHERIAGTERCVCTVLMDLRGETVGGILISRSASLPFSPDEIEKLKHLADVLGPVLETRRLADRGALSRAYDGVTHVAQRLLGSGHSGLKATTLGIAALFAFLAFANGTHYVSAPAVIEGTIERDLVAPIDGFVAAAHVRAGARVHAGEVLATLDDKPLRLERDRLEGHRDELSSEYDQALGVLDHAATRVLGAQIRQAESQLSLVEEQLERIRIVAPFDGLIVRGDLSQSLGSPVSRGDLLFSLAPLEGYRVVLDINEHDVPAIRTGAVGQLILAALPRQRFDIRVERMNGITRSADARNVLEVETALVGASEQLRPGMHGVARVDAGPARLLWIWTHRLVDRLRLWWWAWSPVV